MPSLESLTNDLKQAFESKDYGKVETLMTPIKVLLIQNDLLLPNFNKLTKNDENYLNDLIISRSILEIGALSLINLSKFDKFQQIIDSLKIFYFNDINLEALSKSSKRNKLLSLYLLLLLSDGDFVKFYTELEYYTFRLTNVENDLFLKYPITLANWLLEGYYDKVLKILSNSSNEELFESKLKLKEFQIFDEILIKITREEIAKTLNKSYNSLDFKNTKNLLYLKENDDENLKKFIDEFNWKSNNVKNELNFNDNDEINNDYDYNDDENGNLTNTEKIVKNSLNYAKEIDLII